MRDPEQVGQLTFDALLVDAAVANQVRGHDRRFGHLPGTMEAAVPYFQDLIARHHRAMFGGDAALVERLRGEAHDLARKLNGYEAGILADEDAPGCVLARLTRAEAGTVPQWGQVGSFEIRHRTMRVRIELEGLFGIGALNMSWLSFSAHAIEKGRPFLSDTGYRSFQGTGGLLAAGYTPDTFAAGVVGEYVERELKGQLFQIRSVDGPKLEDEAGAWSSSQENS
jgi:hypothetical protein